MFLHVPGFSGALPSLVYPWNRAPWLTFFPLIGVAALPLAAALWFGSIRVEWRVAMLAASVLLFRLLVVFAKALPGGYHYYIRAIQNKAFTSYHTDAWRFFREGVGVIPILSKYSQLLPYMILHSREKPPGPVLFYYAMLCLFGPGNLPAIAGLLVIATVELLSVVAVYWLAKFWLDDKEIAFRAAALFCIFPGFLEHFPQFDTCYPAVVCGWAALWGLYMRHGRLAYAVAFAVLLTLATFWVYNLLVCGILLVGVSILESRRGVPKPIQRFLAGAAIVLAICFASYGILYLCTGYNPVSAFLTSMKLQKDIDDQLLHRYYPATMPIDMMEFSVGVGWGVAAAAIATLFRRSSDPKTPPNAWPVAIVCAAQIGIVAASGLLKCETSRVWIFMMPLVAIPAACEITRWPRVWRGVFYAATWLTMAAIAQNI